jgi:hypothetical protein
MSVTTSMSPARKEDESVQTSLKELMRQEEERTRQERERLEQLRAAKIRIDRERAEAAREQEERRATVARDHEREQVARLDAIKAAEIERVRLEVLAKADADQRAQEMAARVQIELAAKAPTLPPPSKTRWVSSGAMLGFVVACVVGAIAWNATMSDHQAKADRALNDATTELEKVRRDNAASRAADHDTIVQQGQRIERLEQDNQRLQTALDGFTNRPGHPTAPRLNTNTPSRPTCTNPHDPLCGDLDAR